MKKLYYTFHERYTPMTYNGVLKEPYNFKELRKIVDSCAFTTYGHWVKKTPDQIQNRTALFENALKNEIVKSDTVDGHVVIPSMYSYGLTHAFLPRQSSFARKGSYDQQPAS